MNHLQSTKTSTAYGVLVLDGEIGNRGENRRYTSMAMRILTDALECSEVPGTGPPWIGTIYNNPYLHFSRWCNCAYCYHVPFTSCCRDIPRGIILSSR